MGLLFDLLLKDDKNEKEKDEKTSKFADMLRRKDKILVKMKEHSQNRTL